MACIISADQDIFGSAWPSEKRDSFVGWAFNMGASERNVQAKSPAYTTDVQGAPLIHQQGH